MEEENSWERTGLLNLPILQRSFALQNYSFLVCMFFTCLVRIQFISPWWETV